MVGLYLDRTKEGSATKLAYMWHGPFKVAEMFDRNAAIMEAPGTEYRQFPIVHVTKLKLVKTYPYRPTTSPTGDKSVRVYFSESLLPEDS